jgi:hypothetical protein
MGQAGPQALRRLPKRAETERDKSLLQCGIGSRSRNPVPRASYGNSGWQQRGPEAELRSLASSESSLGGGRSSSR